MSGHVTTAAIADFPARYFRARDGRDAAAATALLADAFTWEDPSARGPMRTLEDAVEFLERTWVSFPDLQFELVDEPLVAGSRVAQRWRMTGTHQGEGVPAGVPGTGRSVDVAGMHLFMLDADGRATEVRAFYDALALAAQLGMVIS